MKLFKTKYRALSWYIYTEVVLRYGVSMRHTNTKILQTYWKAKDIQCANERLLKSDHRKEQGSNDTTH